MSLNVTIGANVAPAVAGIKIVQQSVSKLGDTLETLKAKSLAKQEFIKTEKNVANIAILNREVQALEAEIARVQNIGKQGFDELGNAVSAGSSKIVEGANNAFSAVRKLAFILPGIGIAGLLGGLSDLVVGLFSSTQSVKDATAALEVYKQKLEDITDSLKTLKEGLDFRAELNTLQFKLNQGLAVPGSVADLQNKKDFNQFASSEKIKANDFDLKEIDKTLTKLNDDFQKGQKIIGVYKQQLAEATKQGLEVNSPLAKALSFSDLTKVPKSIIDDLKPVEKAFLEGFISTNDKIKELDEQRTKIINENSILRVQSQIQENEDTEAIRKKAEELQKAANQRLISEAKRQQEELQRIFFIVPGNVNITPFDNLETQLQKAKEFFKINQFEVRIPLDIDLPKTKDRFKEKLANPDIILGGRDQFRLKIALAIDNATKAEIKKQLDALNKIVSSGTADIVASFSEGIGNLIAGVGSVGDVFGGVFKSIGAGLEQLGKAMIAHAIAIIAFKNAFKNPFVELAAGAALIIAGAAVQASIGRTSKFAQGGLVFGPTLGLVGEGSGTSRSNPEVIAPLDKLKNMIGGVASNNVNISGMFRIAGKDLALVLARNQSSDLRTT